MALQQLQENDLKQIPQMQQSFFTMHTPTDKIGYLITALMSLDSATLLLFQKTWFTQQLFGVGGDSKVDLGELLNRLAALSSHVDSVVFDSLAECYNQSPAGTIQALKSSGLRPGKIKDFTDALTAASVAPQLRDDVQTDRLTMGDVADLGHSTTRIRKDNLTRAQHRRLLTEGRKPLLNFRSTEPSRGLRSAHARKAVTSAVRENCPSTVKPPKARRPKASFGVRMSASGHSLTLCGAPTLLDRVRSELSTEAPHYLNALLNSPPRSPGNDSNPHQVDLGVLLESTPPEGVFHGQSTRSERNQAEGLSLVHALVIGVQQLTGRKWNEKYISDVESIELNTNNDSRSDNSRPHTESGSDTPRKPGQNQSGSLSDSRSAEAKATDTEPLTAQAITNRTKRKVEKQIETLENRGLKPHNPSTPRRSKGRKGSKRRRRR